MNIYDAAQDHYSVGQQLCHAIPTDIAMTNGDHCVAGLLILCVEPKSFRLS